MGFLNRRAWLLFVAAPGLLSPMAPSQVRADTPLESVIKAVFLFKFGDFVEWPPKAFARAEAPFTIGILGQDPFDGSLDQAVQNRTVQGRPVVVKRFSRVEEVQDVQVLYLSASESERWKEDLARLRGMEVLTVGEQGQQPGVVITFVLQDGKVRFKIDQDAADRAGLKLSSKLLSLAVAVKRRG